ncbi:MAG: glycosyltransferase family 2 protein [Desulfovibrionaceae bacterium]|nr:glycosyltransferase family 2 protein [Desulfovibrionaceae bacterium]
MNNLDTSVFKFLEHDKSIFKIVTKTKNEHFFIEKWIVHHLNILKGTKLIIFDNMSDDDYVLSIYRKYKDNIIIVKFDMYMDKIHMANNFLQLYKSLSVSSKFFTIIDSDEYLYLYDGDKVIKDNSIVKFLEDNADCNFFTPCWIENLANNEKLFSFSPLNLSYFHFSKPIINSKMIHIFETALSKYECPILHHTQQLPILTYGKTKTKFLLAHLKNLNKYQRIKSNMQKLSSVKVIKNESDFYTLLNGDINTINGSWRNYVIETRNLIENLHFFEKFNENETIELCDNGVLKFTPESYEQEFKSLMNSDYFDLINFDINKVDINQHTTIRSCMHLLQ